MRKISFKKFLLISLLLHFILLLVLVLAPAKNIKNEQSKNDVVDISKSVKINDIADDSIYKEMLIIKKENEAAENVARTLRNNIEAVKKQAEKIKKLRKKEEDINKSIAEKSSNINKLIIDEKNLKNDNLKLQNENIAVEKSINIKKKATELKALKEKIKKKERDNILTESKHKTKPKKTVFNKNGEYDKHFSNYIKKIGDVFRVNWTIPVNSMEDWACTVKISQTGNGDISGYNFMSNCPKDPEFIASIQRSIKMSSPLALPPKSLDFNDVKEITLEFKMNI